MIQPCTFYLPTLPSTYSVRAIVNTSLPMESFHCEPASLDIEQGKHHLSTVFCTQSITFSEILPLVNYLPTRSSSSGGCPYYKYISKTINGPAILYICMILIIYGYLLFRHTCLPTDQFNRRQSTYHTTTTKVRITVWTAPFIFIILY